MKNVIFPAEWHPQSGIQLTWPHKNTDWSYMLPEVEACFVQIAKHILQYEPLLVVSPEPDNVRKTLIENGVSLENVRFEEIDTNDTWARDHGGITVYENGKATVLDFKFNGWGLKFAANKDNLITSKLFESQIFNAIYKNELNFALEGGSVESDGCGTLLTTAECLLSPNRNGASSQEEIEQCLKDKFGVKKVLWLNHGYLAGDDTDSHIDTLARLCPDNVIVYVQCTNQTDEHYVALKAMEDELKTFSNAAGERFKLLPLPMADAVYCDEERLPATYANFVILNKAVLVPIYNQPQNDAKALAVIKEAFPQRDVIGIDCSALIKQHGSLHCVTMQFPEGVFNLTKTI